VKKILIVVVALVGAYYATSQPPSSVDQRSPGAQPSNAALERAISARLAGYQVRGSGKVARLLSDDDDGSRHQRFILQLKSGRTLLIAHNIDLAPRIIDLRPGETVSFFGEYEWNVRGGVIHWTHHDPRAQHIDGWVEYRDKRYQ
jgi:hypothetical protein